MSTLASRGYPAGSIDAFTRRVAGDHTAQWRADIKRFAGGGAVEVVAVDVPLVSGELILDSGDLYRRRCRLELGGGEEWAPRTSSSPAVPFGQWLELSVRVDDGAGGWLPYLKMGELWITSHTFERPSLIATVEGVDWSGAVDEYLHTARHGYRNLTVRQAVVQMVEAALPDKAVDVVVATDNASRKVENYVASSGLGRWEAATNLAGLKGVDPLFDALGRLVFRRELVDDDPTSGAGGLGPDIGAVDNPVAVIRDGIGGNLVALTATLTREGACNGVVVNLHATVKRRGRKQPVEVTRRIDVLEDRAGSAVAWGDRFGRLPIVREHNVNKITSELVDGHRDRARALLQRRRGLVRYLDADVAPIYWLEADDRVRVEWLRDDAEIVAENHYMQRLVFEITGGPMRVRTRQLSVTDPGA